MRTDHLIQALVADNGTQERAPGRQLALALAGGVFGSLLIYAATLAPRDFAVALLEPRFVFKLVVVAALALVAWPLVDRMARPDGEARWGQLIALVIVPLVLAVGVGLELTLVDPAAWRATLVGENAATCVLFVPLLSVPVLVATIWALRQGAPTRPDLAGVFAGLLAGGVGALLYGSHCPDDSPLFVAVWYPIGIAVVVLVARWVGSRTLTW